MPYRTSISFIGGGNMAEALIGGIIRSGLVDPIDITVAEPRPGRRDELAEKYDIMVTDNNFDAAQAGATVILATKPQVFPEIMGGIAASITTHQLVISVAAGITLSQLQADMPDVPVIRSMPNTPALIGAGATVISTGFAVTAEMTQWATEIFHTGGKCFVLSEELMDAVTGLSGSGPAYIFRMAEAMTEAGVAQGIPAEQAGELTRQTILGAARMMVETDNTPSQLREQVTSPGGTTEAGLAAMDEAGFEEAVAKGIAAATDRACELGRQ
jgi:pyrroline-5-carboxylate reductase